MKDANWPFNEDVKFQDLKFRARECECSCALVLLCCVVDGKIMLCLFQCCPFIYKKLNIHANSGCVWIHTYLDFQFNLIFGPIHNYHIPNVIVPLCITLSKPTHLDRIDIHGGLILTIQICIKFRVCKNGSIIKCLRFALCILQQIIAFL
jgi:hypothetical protein